MSDLGENCIRRFLRDILIHVQVKTGLWVNRSTVFDSMFIELVYNTHKHIKSYTRKKLPMRTNIVLDDKLIERAQKLTGIKTKREVVHEALRLLILLNEQGEIRALRGKLPWDGNLGDQRQSRVKVN